MNYRIPLKTIESEIVNVWFFCNKSDINFKRFLVHVFSIIQTSKFFKIWTCVKYLYKGN